MLSILKVQLPNYNSLPPRLSSSATMVRSLLVLEASSALIDFNGFIQRQPPWYLQIPLLRAMNMIQTELQVREQILYAPFKNHHLHKCLLIFQTTEDRDLWKWYHRRMIRLVNSMHYGTHFHAHIYIFGLRLHRFGRGSHVLHFRIRSWQNGSSISPTYGTSV